MPNYFNVSMQICWDDLDSLPLHDHKQVSHLVLIHYSSFNRCTDLWDVCLNILSTLYPINQYKILHAYLFSLALRGKLRVTSFSWLDPEQELDYMNRSMLDVRTNELSGRHNSVIKRPARFEGLLIIVLNVY